MSFYFFSGSLDWILVNNNVRPPDLIQDGLRSQKFVVLDLKPKTNYILRITAHNSAGSTVKEFSFTTLNSDGTPLASEGLKKDHHSEFVLPIVLVAFTITSIVLGTRLLLFFLKKCYLILNFLLFSTFELFFKKLNHHIKNYLVIIIYF